MAKFSWKARTRSGTQQHGVMEADSTAAVEQTLRRHGFSLISVREQGRGLSRELRLPKMGGGKVSARDVVVFTRQFATMIDAGLPLVQCLDILASQQDKPFFKSILKTVKEDVEGGATFAAALAKHPRVFDDLYVNLVCAGETGGILDTILNRLAHYIEKSMQLKQQIKKAMVYPVTIIVIAMVVVAIIMIAVIPTFAAMFASFGRELPLPTRIVIAMSNFMVHWSLAIVAGMAALFYGARRYYRSLSGRRVIDRLALKLPVLGLLVRKVAVAKFTRTLGTMVSSGVPILDGLNIVAKTAGNTVVEQAVQGVRAAVSEGSSMAEPLAACGVFPPMVVQMIAVGEATGAMDAMLAKIADFYDQEVDHAVSALTAMMEPLLMVFLGVVVGGLVISMYLPIFQMADAVG